MIKAEELKNLADDGLDALAADVEKELTRRKNRRTREAIRTAKKILAAAGFDVQLIPLGSSPQEAAGGAQTGKSGKLPSIPPGTYRSPSGEEWQTGGRGRPPKWITDALAANEDLNSYRVDEQE